MGRYNPLKTLAVSAALFGMGASSVIANPPSQPVCPTGKKNVLVETDITAFWNNYYSNYYPDPQADSFAESQANFELCRSWYAPPRSVFQRKFGATQKACYIGVPNPTTSNGSVVDYFANVSNPSTLWFVGCVPDLDPRKVGPRLSPRVPSVSLGVQ